MSEIKELKMRQCLNMEEGHECVGRKYCKIEQTCRDDEEDMDDWQKRTQVMDGNERMGGCTEFLLYRLQAWDILQLPNACLTAGRKTRRLVRDN